MDGFFSTHIYKHYVSGGDLNHIYKAIASAYPSNCATLFIFSHNNEERKKKSNEMLKYSKWLIYMTVFIFAFTHRGGERK